MILILKFTDLHNKKNVDVAIIFQYNELFLRILSITSFIQKTY